MYALANRRSLLSLMSTLPHAGQRWHSFGVHQGASVPGIMPRSSGGTFRVVAALEGQKLVLNPRGDAASSRAALGAFEIAPNVDRPVLAADGAQVLG